MKKIETLIPGVYIIEPEVFGDHRGWFMENWSIKSFDNCGLRYDFVQDNQSFTANKGTIRGIHFQNSPMSQAKLVRVTRGSVLDVAIDLRKGSPTYKRWVSVELSAENKKMLMIPRGFGHGFCTITDNVEFCYKVDNLYSQEHDRSICFNDSTIGIDWGVVDESFLSEKDRTGPTLDESDCNFIYEEINRRTI